MPEEKDDSEQSEPANAALAPDLHCPICATMLESLQSICPQDGGRPLSFFEADREFKTFKFISIVGSGGMGVIYMAKQMALNKLFAIKMLRSHFVSASAIQRFQIEGKAVSKLDHPFIIKVHNLGLCQSGPYMIMDYLEGRNLAQVLEQDGPLSLERCLKIFVDACDALGHAHKRGVLHRDLKPSNIMLRTNFRDEEEVCIMDFGIAKILDESLGEAEAARLTRTGEAIGSPHYMSPEQARAASVDARSDLYSLGCVIYEALTGTPPFQGNTPMDTLMMHMKDKPLSLSQATLGAKSFDKDIETVIDRLLQKNPDWRYQSMEELKAHLTSIRDGAGIKPFIYSGSPQRIANRSVYLAAVVMLFIFAIGVAIFAMWRSGSEGVHKPPASLPDIVETMPSIRGALRVCANADIVDPSLFGLSDDITDRDLVVFESAEHASTILLKKASLITGEGLKYLEGLPNLTKLDLSWCPRLRDVSACAKMKHLQTLVLEGDHIGDGELEALKGMQVKSLILESTRVKKLPVVKSLSALTELKVERTPIDGDALKNIGKVKSLEKLDLDGTDIKGGDLQYLGNLSRLEELHLNFCIYVTQADIDRLKKKLRPDVTVLFSLDARQSKRNEAESLDKAIDLGFALDHNGHTVEAIKRLEAIRKLLSTHRNPNGKLLAKCDRVLCEVYMHLPGNPPAKFERALACINNAISICEGGELPDLDLSDYYHMKGMILQAQQKTKEEIDAYEMSEKLLAKSPGALHVKIVQQRQLILRVIGIERSKSNADSELEMAQKELERGLALGHTSVSGSLCHPLAFSIKKQAGRLPDSPQKTALYKKALELYLQADEYEKHAPPDLHFGSSESTAVKTEIALVQISLGDVEPAEKTLKAVLLLGSSDMQLRETQINALIGICKKTGRLREAQKYREKLAQLKAGKIKERDGTDERIETR